MLWTDTVSLLLDELPSYTASSVRIRLPRDSCGEEFVLESIQTRQSLKVSSASALADKIKVKFAF